MADMDSAMLSQVIAALNELHTTTDQKRCRELDDALTMLKKCKFCRNIKRNHIDNIG